MIKQPHDIADSLAQDIRAQAQRPDDGLPASRIAAMLRALYARVEALEAEVARLKQAQPRN